MLLSAMRVGGYRGSVRRVLCGLTWWETFSLCLWFRLVSAADCRVHRLERPPSLDMFRACVCLDWVQVISANSFKPIEPVSSFDKFLLMRRLRKIGGILMTLHNVLMMEAPYDLLEKLFRKCCVR